MSRGSRRCARGSATAPGFGWTTSWDCSGCTGSPEDHRPAEGAYVRYPHDDLLNILALEAHRAGAFRGRGGPGHGRATRCGGICRAPVMSYRVWWFEDDPPATWPRKALGAVTTHDLPTVAGVLTGSDLEQQRRLGLQPNEDAASPSSASCWSGPDRTDTPVEQVIERVYADLAQAPCLLLTASLDDALAVEERPNMPGTIDEWPNWSIALPLPLEELERPPWPEASPSA